MAKAFRLITINNYLITRMKDRLKCVKCGLVFKLGEKVFSHYKQNRRKTPLTEYYCKKCYRSLYI